MILHRRSGGFSLLEVLVAIVVLTVGLLALAALQGSLTRSSADAKVRARVASMLAARMDALRSGSYGQLLPEGIQPPKTTVSGDACSAASTADAWRVCARE